MTRTTILMKRFIRHDNESFHPSNSYTVDTDVATAFVEKGYAIVQEPDTTTPLSFEHTVELESKVEIQKRKRKGQD